MNTQIDDEAELSVLGSILLNPGCLGDVRKIIGDDMKVFAFEPHQHIYKGMLQLQDRGRPIDVMLLKQQLAKMRKLKAVGGVEYISELSNAVPASANVIHYADLMIVAYKTRGLLKVSRRILTGIKDQDPQEVVSYVSQELSRISALGITRDDHLVMMKDVISKRVEWISPGRLPRGKLCVIEGDPGLGKSTITLDFAARISTGAPFPGQTESRSPAGVVLVSAEDDPEDSVKPRLEAAQADPDRIVSITGAPDSHGGQGPLCLPDHLGIVEDAINKVDADLVVIDPLMAFLSGGINAHKDQDVRRALYAFSEMAQKSRATFLIVRHLNKTTGTNHLYRGGGSIAIIAAARVGLLVAKDPENEGRNVLAVAKSNIGVVPPSLLYRIGVDESQDVSRVKWEGTTSLQASDLLQVSQKVKNPAEVKAMNFLTGFLADGPRAAKLVMKEANDEGISEKTLIRAKGKLGVRSKHRGQPGEKGRWYWSFPDDGHEEAKVANENTWSSSSDNGHLGLPEEAKEEFFDC